MLGNKCLMKINFTVVKLSIDHSKFAKYQSVPGRLVLRDDSEEAESL